MRHSSDGFAVIGTVHFDGADEVVARQSFVDNEPYRAARRGKLIVDKFASRRRFEGWGAWAQDRIRVSRYRIALQLLMNDYNVDCQCDTKALPSFFLRALIV